MKPSTPLLSHDSSGFTLIEVIAVIIILGIISVFSYLFIVTGVSGYITTYENTVLAQKAGIAMARISTELLEEMAAVEAFDSGTAAANAYIKYGCDAANCSSGFRYLILLGSGSRKKLVLADQTSAPDASNEEVLMDNISSFTIELFSDCENETVWSPINDEFDEIACSRITLVVYLNETDTDTETFETTIRPVALNDVI